MLRDALAAGARTALAHDDELHGPECSCVVLADAILADPAFRAALTESIAEALYVKNMSVRGSQPNTSGGYLTADEVAAAIVAQMLGETS